jgi:hypothetical protein
MKGDNMTKKPFSAWIDKHNRISLMAAKRYMEIRGEKIKEAIIKQRDDWALCEELGANARKAYEERYSWEIMERRLVDIYQELTDEVGEMER